jgi:hypothetical protein
MYVPPNKPDKPERKLRAVEPAESAECVGAAADGPADLPPAPSALSAGLSPDAGSCASMEPPASSPSPAAHDAPEPELTPAETRDGRELAVAAGSDDSSGTAREGPASEIEPQPRSVSFQVPAHAGDELNVMFRPMAYSQARVTRLGEP